MATFTEIETKLTSLVPPKGWDEDALPDTTEVGLFICKSGTRGFVLVPITKAQFLGWLPDTDKKIIKLTVEETFDQWLNP